MIFMLLFFNFKNDMETRMNQHNRAINLCIATLVLIASGSHAYATTRELPKAKKCPVKQTQINATPQQKFDRCIICQDDIDDPSNTSQLRCKHMFHIDCIASWLVRKLLCPLCKAPVDPTALKLPKKICAQILYSQTPEARNQRITQQDVGQQFREYRDALCYVDNINERFGDSQQTLLESACLREDLIAIQAILAYQPTESQEPLNPNTRDSEGYTPLHRAAQQNSALVITLLLTHPKIKANSHIPGGNTALHIAAELGNTAALWAILQHPTIATNIHGVNHLTPLHCAVLGGHKRAVQKLLNHKCHGLQHRVNPNAKIKNSSKTPLHLAVQVGDPAIVTRLLGNPNILVNPRDSTGATPLDYAIESHQDALADLLRAHGGMQITTLLEASD
jgi:ankyrin repeat protein